MSLPNFMIIGAGKAGSTSLWQYVGQHPDVFPTPMKEPSYFWTYKHTKPGKTMTPDAYTALFEGSESYKAVGEASPGYLADENAPFEIHNMIPNVKLIAILRDPCARAFSEFMMQRSRGDESEVSFLDAAAADPNRPPERRFNYVENGLYHKHLSRYLIVFPAKQIKVILNEDLRAKPKDVVRDVFLFLGIDPNVEIDTDIDFTVSGVPKNKALHWLLGTNNAIKTTLAPLLPDRLTRALRQVRNANLERRFMTPRERSALLPRFETDTLKLEKLLERDLSRWQTL